MAQRRDRGSASPSRTGRRPDPAGAIGDHLILTSLRRDELGEVCAATGPAGEVRIRLVAVEEPESFDAALAAAGAVVHPAVAPTLERLVAGEATALVGPADLLTLADRRRRGAVGTATAVATGAALLDGLVALHGAGAVHGAVGPGLVGIDADGRPRWRDAGVWAARRRRGPADAPGPEDDVLRFTRMARDLGNLPAELATAVDRIAAQEVPAPTARALARLWRDLAGIAGVAVPPPGVAVRAAGLLGPAPRRRRPVPRLVRGATAVVAALLAVALVPVAHAGPGGAAPFDDVGSYLPSNSGQRLVYSFQQSIPPTSSVTRTVALRVGAVGTVAGLQTVELSPDRGDTPSSGGRQQYPFGLGGGTLRVQSGAVVRAAQGGTVRDIQGPLRPGLRWSDSRAGVADLTTTETRDVLGPGSITEPSGHFDRCVVIALASVVDSAATGRSSTAAGYAWYCPGVGLTRALLVSSSGESDTIDLVSTG